MLSVTLMVTHMSFLILSTLSLKHTTALCYADHTVRKADERTFLHRSTAGWQVCVLWKYGSTSWGKLSDLKELHSLETAEYAVSQSLEREPAFHWWVTFVPKKCARNIYLVQQRSARYLKCNQKYRINIPKTVEEALMIYKSNGNTL